MSLTLVTTPGASNANSYCTVEEADAYHDGYVLFRDDWPETGTDTDQIKERALIAATRVLDDMYTWASWQTFPGVQRLEWPRVGILGRSRLVFIGSSEIPNELKQAVAELARQLITADRTADNDIESLKIRQLAAGSVNLSFGDGVQSKIIPDAVYFLIPSWWGDVQSRTDSVRMLIRA